MTIVTDNEVERVARAICWAMTEETDDCSSRCLSASRCMADSVEPCFIRDARAALAASDRDVLVAEIERLREALNIFVRAAYPVASEINERGHNWSEAYLDEALPIARAALTPLGGEGR